MGDAQAPALAFGVAPQAFMPGQRAQRGAAVAAGLFQQDGAAAGQGQAFRLPAPFQKGPVGILSCGTGTSRPASRTWAMLAALSCRARGNTARRRRSRGTRERK